MRAKNLSTGLMNFTADRIPLNPYAFVEYHVLKTPEGMYRRAVYNRSYVVIYKIETDTLLFLDVYHTSRNKGSLANE